MLRSLFISIRLSIRLSVKLSIGLLLGWSTLLSLPLLSLTTAAVAADTTVSVTLFSERERAAISSHYLALQRDAAVYAQYHSDRDAGQTKHDKAKKDKGAKTLPPGLQQKAEQGRLPPGWQKKLKAGSKLPPDILAVAESLPPSLVAQLPAGPAGTITVHVDGQIIRLLEASRTIVDFFGLPR